MSFLDQIRASRSQLENFSRSYACGVYYGDHRLLCRILGDILLFVDIYDYTIGPRLVLDGFWEAWVTLAIARYLKPGMWCVDVGANYGYYTLLMASICGPNGHVLACEPNPVLSKEFLPQNIALNSYHDRVDICSLIVSDKDDEQVEFVVNRNHAGWSSLKHLSKLRQADVVKMPTITLDSLCNNWSRLDFVKIDAEGSETLIWKGMQKILKRFPGVVIALELHFREGKSSIERFLCDLNNECALRYVNYSGDIMPVDPITIVSNPHEHWMLWLQR